MPLTSYEATRLYQLEQTQGLSLVEIRLRDSMRAREPEQAAEIATKAATDLVRAAVGPRHKGETTDEPVLAGDHNYRAADLRSKLREFGAARAGLDDALTLLERRLPGEYTEATLEGAVAHLRNTRPELFVAPRRPSTSPRAAVRLTEVGAGGVARAKLRFETNSPSTS